VLNVAVTEVCLQGARVMAGMAGSKLQACRSMCGCAMKAKSAASPARSTSLENPAVENGPGSRNGIIINGDRLYLALRYSGGAF
jgi:hypothetical protein